MLSLKIEYSIIPSIFQNMVILALKSEILRCILSKSWFRKPAHGADLQEITMRGFSDYIHYKKSISLAFAIDPRVIATHLKRDIHKIEYSLIPGIFQNIIISAWKPEVIIIFLSSPHSVYIKD